MGNPAGQAPWMDDNGDGLSNKDDGDLAARHVIGRYPAFGLTAPTIVDVAATRTVAVGDPVSLWADMGEAVAVTDVWAVVAPQGAAYDARDPVTNLTRVTLARGATPNRWRATWTPTMRHLGHCTVTYFAVTEDASGTCLVANPVAAGLEVRATGARIPWQLYE
jgi:hypothetical protein